MGHSNVLHVECKYWQREKNGIYSPVFESRFDKAMDTARLLGCAGIAIVKKTYFADGTVEYETAEGQVNEHVNTKVFYNGKSGINTFVVEKCGSFEISAYPQGRPIFTEELLLQKVYTKCGYETIPLNNRLSVMMPGLGLSQDTIGIEVVRLEYYTSKQIKVLPSRYILFDHPVSAQVILDADVEEEMKEYVREHIGGQFILGPHKKRLMLVDGEYTVIPRNLAFEKK